MDSRKFTAIVIGLVTKYVNSHREPNNPIGQEDVYIVWISKVLQNNKALASTTLRDGLYFEVTYNGDKNELYFDVYKVDDMDGVYMPYIEREQ